nr:hypothetical protein [Paratractidigestivibacter sp.]
MESASIALSALTPERSIEASFSQPSNISSAFDISNDFGRTTDLSEPHRSNIPSALIAPSVLTPDRSIKLSFSHERNIDPAVLDMVRPSAGKATDSRDEHSLNMPSALTEPEAVTLERSTVLSAEQPLNMPEVELQIAKPEVGKVTESRPEQPLNILETSAASSVTMPVKSADLSQMSSLNASFSDFVTWISFSTLNDEKTVLEKSKDSIVADAPSPRGRRVKQP